MRPIHRLRNRFGTTALGVAIAFANLLPAPGALAQDAKAPTGSIFVCKDERGRTLTSDRPIPECASKPMRELRADGALRREIAPPLTAEQREQQRLEELLRYQEDEQRRQATARDRALLLAYRDEDALERARQRQLADIDADIAVAMRRLQQLEPVLVKAQAQVAAYETANPKKPVPQSLLQQVSAPATEAAAEKSLIETRRAEREQIDRRFDDERRRLRELLSRPHASAEAPSRVR